MLASASVSCVAHSTASEFAPPLSFAVFYSRAFFYCAIVLPEIALVCQGTLLACDALCDAVDEAETLLARGTSLLHKVCRLADSLARLGSVEFVFNVFFASVYGVLVRVLAAYYPSVVDYCAVLTCCTYVIYG